MNSPRVLLLVALMAVLAACSGNIGGGQSTLPGAPPQNGTNVQQIAPAPTPTPVSATGVATIGDNESPQALPAVMGWGGTIAFAKPSAAPSATPNPKHSAQSNDAGLGSTTSIGITSSTVQPSDAPRLGAPKHHAKADPSTLTPLFFISLLPTSDLTLNEYPKIAVDMPREIAAKHRDETFGLALFDPQTNKTAYTLSVAERDLTSPLPGATPVAAVPMSTPQPSMTPFSVMNGPAEFTPPPVGTGFGDALPPEHVAFKSTATSLLLKANRPVVFALYALPSSPSPSPSPSNASTVSPNALATPAPTSTPHA